MKRVTRIAKELGILSFPMLHNPKDGTDQGQMNGFQQKTHSDLRKDFSLSVLVRCLHLQWTANAILSDL